MSTVDALVSRGGIGRLLLGTRWPGWRALPRDARDTLFLLAVIAWTVLPHASHLPTWTIALVVAVLAWRGRVAVSGGALPGRWMLVGVLAVAIVLTLVTFRTLLGKEPGVTLAVALMALKTLELRARRDAFVVFFLGFFIILTHFLYSQSLLVAGAMLVSVWGLLTAVVLAHMPVGQPSLARAGALAARTAMLGAPVMALLFLLFPRIGPLWGVPQDGGSKTGLSNALRLGSLAEVATDDSIAMRIRFEGPAPAPSALYFRGPVLTRFDGTEWTPLALPFAANGVAPRPATVRSEGAPVRYELTLEPLRVASVPMLEATTSVTPTDGFAPSPRDDLQWLLPRPLNERVRFHAEAQTRFVLGSARRGAETYEARELPPGFNPRTVAWARALRDHAANRDGDAQAYAQLLLARIRSGGYSYTLAPGEYGRDAIDEFWLDRKEGFCEHYAAAFVVAMRAAGYPARIVTGYQGADPLSVDDYWIVRQSAAHAWAEFWQAGTGWIRADPTGAVAPDRINRSRRLAPPPGFVAGALDAMNPELLASWRNAWEAVNNRWNQWVLTYSRGQQLAVLRRLGFSSPSWEDLALLLTFSLSTLALAGATWAWFDRHRVDPWVRQLERIKRRLASLGVPVAPHDPPRALAAHVRERLGDDGEALALALDTLERQRYGRAARQRPDPGVDRIVEVQWRRLRSQAGR